MTEAHLAREGLAAANTAALCNVACVPVNLRASADSVVEGRQQQTMACEHCQQQLKWFFASFSGLFPPFPSFLPSFVPFTCGCNVSHCRRRYTNTNLPSCGGLAPFSDLLLLLLLLLGGQVRSV